METKNKIHSSSLRVDSIENTIFSSNVEVLQEKILKVLFVLIWILAFIHMLAEVYYLYWILDWFDIVTHVLGGLWLGISALWFWYLSGYIKKAHFPDKKAFYIALCAGLIFGFFWEVYEYAVWQWSGSGLPNNYLADTILDLFVDLIGAFLGFFTFSFLVKKM